jgi:hypothetical protein
MINYFRVCGMNATDNPRKSMDTDLLIIFVAWIMDEGRKIQEEQELTV